MGYTTKFDGVLAFTRPLASINELTLVEYALNELDERGFEWQGRKYNFDLCLSKGRSGLVWTGMEKTYGMEYAIVKFVELIQKTIPDLGLQGSFTCQGEEVTDRYTLTLSDGGKIVMKMDSAVKACKCPECGHIWEVEQ